MSTIVYVHAHPDDEAHNAGTMSKAVTEGHRVVLVVATNGDHGDVPEDLAEGETLVDRRRREAQASADLIGVHRLVWLGYSDSGMTGWGQNDHPDSLHAATVEEAGAKVAAVLDEEDADVVVGYDWHGGYGHPDHIKVHKIVHEGARVAARRPRVLESTMNRDAMRAMFVLAKEAGMDIGDWNPDAPADDGNPIGTPEADLHWKVDLPESIELRRACFACHASQSDARMILAIPVEAFAASFGTEYFIEPGLPQGMRTGWYLDV